MAIEPFLQPWSGLAYRHIPADSPYGVLDFRFAGLGTTNRWNVPGERTLYLAGDRAVAIAEFARHVRDDYGQFARLLPEHRLFRLEIAIDLTLDLRDAALVQQLSLHNAPTGFLDRLVARAVAGFLRATTPAQAILVPSVPFLDDPRRCLVVCFLDKLPPDLTQWIASVQAEGAFSLKEPG